MLNPKLKLYIIALGIAIFPHFIRLPLWVMAWCVMIWGYLLLSQKYNWPKPNAWVRRSLTIIGIVGVFIDQKMYFGGGFYLALMAIMAGLKPLEIRSYRDGMVTLFVAYFIVITSVFVSETLFVTAYMFLSICFTTGVLVYIHQGISDLKPGLILSGKLIVQALPLMLILFLLFPRIRGGLWGFSPSQTGKTGFSNTLSLGDISKLVTDDSVAFKVEFEGDEPSYADMYWRGLVLDQFDGRRWISSNTAIPWQKKELEGDISSSYRITLEPHGYRWIFALDLPVSSPPGVRLYSDYTLKTRYFVKKRFHYQMKSLTRYSTGNIEPWEKDLNTVPPIGNPKAQLLARSWKEQGLSDTELVEKALQFFRQGEFVYTLNPPVLLTHPVDRFLFETQKGYCEHFASSFVLLMRAAGVPARIIVGYLGGQKNPFGSYMNIRQKDAHAWSEVFLPERGWVRIDPTAVVAPERVERGPVDGFDAKQTASGFLSKWPMLNDLWQQVQLRLDFINYQWDIWFSGYSYQEQQSILDGLGITYRSMIGWLKIAGFILGTLLLPIVSIWFWYHRKIGLALDKTQLIYEKFCTKLSRIGFRRKPSQGPLDYYKAIISQKPALESQVHEIFQLYIALRYSRYATVLDLKKFKQQVKKFDPNQYLY